MGVCQLLNSWRDSAKGPQVLYKIVFERHHVTKCLVRSAGIALNPRRPPRVALNLVKAYSATLNVGVFQVVGISP